MKYLILVILLEKLTITQNLSWKKITDRSHDKYITTPEFNRVIEENFAARLAQANLVTKTNFDDELKKRNKKNNSSITKHLIVENEF